MKIKSLIIENFKSIERIELIEPNPFTVFVGPNGSGKSNIFEALEFVNLNKRFGRQDALSLMGGLENIRKRQLPDEWFRAEVEFPDLKISILTESASTSELGSALYNEPLGKPVHPNDIADHKQFFDNYTRLFIKNDDLVKLSLNSNFRLALSAKNLEKVLKRILTDATLKAEIFEWLELFVPEFKSLEVVASQFSGEETLLWYEQFSEKPFTKDLISDGTYNILALLTAVYQSDDKPQFLCIEEPENGLHPQVAGELIDFFRIMCEERGHHIWLNTHSQSMIARLKPEEMIIVEKKQGATQIKQIPKDDFKNWRMDEALLMNAFGGGLAW